MRKCAAILIFTIASTAHAASYFEVDLSSKLNSNLQGYANGSNYQLGGSQLDVAGVPFSLGVVNNNPNTTGVFVARVNQTNSWTLNLPIAFRATALYTLINTSFGVAGVQEGSVVVTGSGGETATLNLVEGVNIRDHNDDGYCNTISDPTVVSTYFVNRVPNSTGGQVRLDRQLLVLPASFNGDTIKSVTFNGIANGDPNGSSFIAAMTLANAGGIAGDYNADNKVDAADYVVWRKSPTSFGANPNVYNLWRQNFGKPAVGAGSSASLDASTLVPEPTAVGLQLPALLAITLGCSRVYR
jgi:hypothetical protein